MSTVMRGGARATALVAALLLIILSFGGAGAAYADPGGGNSDENASQSNGNATGADNGNANGAENGNAADNANANGAENGNGAAGDSVVPTVASASSSAGGSGNSADNAAQGSAKGASSSGSSAKGSGSSGKNPADHGKSGNAGTSGTPPAPQPISGADDNSGGANGQCPGGVYCGTTRNKPSANGNGNGKATGRPCAGCVGKADNKNPKGQKPDAARDGNNGYECDGNNGIAKGNPAHTTCQPSVVCIPTTTNPCVSPPVVSCPPGTSLVNGVCVRPPPSAGCPPGTVLVGDDCIAGEEEVRCPDGSVRPTSGVCPKDERPPTVLGDEAFRPRPNEQVLAPAGVLPATGSSSGLGLLAGAGFTMLALGAVGLLRRRIT